MKTPQLEKQSVEKVKNLFYDNRNKCYYFSAKVPVDCFPIYNDERIRRSLGTADHDEAIKLLPKARAEAMAELEKRKVKAPQKGTKTAISNKSAVKTEHHLLTAHVDTVVDNFKASKLSADSHFRRVCNDEARANYKSEITAELEIVKRQLSGDKYQDFEYLAREQLGLEKLVCPPSHLLDELVEKIAIAYRDVLKEILLRLEGDSSNPDPVYFAARDLPTMLDAFMVWTKKQTNIKTIKTFSSHVHRFVEMTGNVPITAIKTSQVLVFAEKLAEQGLSKATIQNFLCNLSTIFNDFRNQLRIGASAKGVSSTALRFAHLGLSKKLVDNPFSNLELRDMEDKKPCENRRPFSDAEAQLVIDSIAPALDATQKKKPKDRDFAFFVFLCLFTGARLEELAQLRALDLIFKLGKPFLRITKEHEGNSIKTKASERLVPLHKELEDIGIVEFIREKTAMAGTQDVFIFASLLSNRADNRKGDAISKRFGRFLDKIGLTDPRLVLHSSRYNVKQCLTISGADPKARDAMLGHWKNSAGDIYLVDETGLFSAKALLKAIGETVFEYKTPKLAELA